MNTNPTIVIQITIASLLAIGCAKEPSGKGEAFARSLSHEPILTTTVSPSIDEMPIDLKEPTQEPSPSKEEKVYEPLLESIDGLTIRRLLTAPEIEGREPRAASSVFGDDEERVYAFIDVSNESDEERALTVNFIGPEGQVSGGIELIVPAMAPRWRTWAYTRHAKEPGLWRVEIRNSEGMLLAAIPFEVSEGC